MFAWALEGGAASEARAARVLAPPSLHVEYDAEHPSLITISLVCSVRQDDPPVVHLRSADAQPPESDLTKGVVFIAFMRNYDATTLCTVPAMKMLRAVDSSNRYWTLTLWLRAHHLKKLVLDVTGVATKYALQPALLAVCEPDPPAAIVSRCAHLITSGLWCVDEAVQTRLSAMWAKYVAAWLGSTPAILSVATKQYTAGPYSAYFLSTNDQLTYVWMGGKKTNPYMLFSSYITPDCYSASQTPYIIYENKTLPVQVMDRINTDNNAREKSGQGSDAQLFGTSDPISEAVAMSNKAHTKRVNTWSDYINDDARKYSNAHHVVRLMTIASTNPSEWQQLRAQIVRRYASEFTPAMLTRILNCRVVRTLDVRASSITTPTSAAVSTPIQSLEQALSRWSPISNDTVACLYMYEYIGRIPDVRMAIKSSITMQTLGKLDELHARIESELRNTSKYYTSENKAQFNAHLTTVDTCNKTLLLKLTTMECSTPFSAQYQSARAEFMAQIMSYGTIDASVAGLIAAEDAVHDASELADEIAKRNFAFNDLCDLRTNITTYISTLKLDQADYVQKMTETLTLVKKYASGTNVANDATKLVAKVTNLTTAIQHLSELFTRIGRPVVITLAKPETVDTIRSQTHQIENQLSSLRCMSEPKGIWAKLEATYMLRYYHLVDQMSIMENTILSAATEAEMGEKKYTCPVTHPVWANRTSDWATTHNQSAINHATVYLNEHKSPGTPDYHAWVMHDDATPLPGIDGKCVAAYPWRSLTMKRRVGWLRSEVPVLTKDEASVLTIDKLAVDCESIFTHPSDMTTSTYLKFFPKYSELPEFKPHVCATRSGMTTVQKTKLTDAIKNMGTLPRRDLDISWIFDDLPGQPANNAEVDAVLRKVEYRAIGAELSTHIPPPIASISKSGGSVSEGSYRDRDDTPPATVEESRPVRPEATISLDETPSTSHVPPSTHASRADRTTDSPIAAAIRRIQDSAILACITANSAARILYAAARSWSRGGDLGPFLDSPEVAIRSVGSSPEVQTRIKALRYGFDATKTKQLYTLYANTIAEVSFELNKSANSANLNQITVYMQIDPANPARIIPNTSLIVTGNKVLAPMGCKEEHKFKAIFKQLPYNSEKAKLAARQEIELTVAAELIGVGPKLLAVGFPCDSDSEDATFSEAVSAYWYIQVRGVGRNVCNNDEYAKKVTTTGLTMNLSTSIEIDRAYRNVFVLTYSLFALGFIHNDEKCGNIIIATMPTGKSSPWNMESRFIDFSADFIKAVNFNASPAALVAKLAASASCFILPNVSVGEVPEDTASVDQLESIRANYNLKTKMVHSPFKTCIQSNFEIPSDFKTLISNNAARDQVATIFPVDEADTTGRLAPFFPTEVFDPVRYNPVSRSDLIQRQSQSVNLSIMLKNMRCGQIFISVFRFAISTVQEHADQRKTVLAALKAAAAKYWHEAG